VKQDKRSYDSLYSTSIKVLTWICFYPVVYI